MKEQTSLNPQPGPLFSPSAARLDESPDPAVAHRNPVLVQANYRTSLALLSALSLGAISAMAQDNAADTTDEEDEIFELSPFEVSSTGSTGYAVKDTLAGARIRTALKDTPSSLSVVTSQFLEDTNVNNAEDLFVYTMNTEVAGLNGTFSGVTSRGVGVNGDESARWANPGGVNRARGLTAMDSTRNFFQSDIPWDGYNISRIDISRGPNSFLFGSGSPSGISNYSTKEAVFDDTGSIEINYGSYGSTRGTIDFNKQITEDFAVRVAAVNSKTKYQQKPAFADSKRQYVAVRYEPNFLKTDSAFTKIQANYEHGENDSRYPRTLPPIDYITGYLSDPTASATGYNPWTYVIDTNTGGDPDESAWSSSGSLANQFGWSNGAPQFYYDAATGVLMDAGMATYKSPTGNGFGSYSNTYQVHSAGYYTYAKTMNYRYKQANGGVDGGDFAGAKIGTVRYHDKTLSDPSLFDFYNNLIDGDNKGESMDWDAYNVSIVQSLFDNRLSVQAIFDHQEVNRGDWGMLGTPTMVLDLNTHNLKTPTWLPGATTNPNLGRPAIYGDQGRNNFRATDRDNYQVTASYNLDFVNDLGADGLWAKILGKHDFTLLGGRYEQSEDNRYLKLNGVDKQYRVLVGDKNNPLETDVGYNWQAYLGDSMLGTTGAGADLSRLQARLVPPGSYPYTVYSNEWTATGVDPQAEWKYIGPDGLEKTQKQIDNPANYKGYTRAILPTIYGDSLPAALRTGGDKREQRVTTKALMWQGHFWDDTIIPSYGYREDETFQAGNESSQFKSNETGIYPFDYDIIDEGVTDKTKSSSYGLALHLPKAIKERLPAGTDVSFYYFHGENETPKIRYAIDGSQLPFETGKTDDFAVQFDGLDGRLTARLTYFQTENKHSSASVGQPLGTFMIRALPEWTLNLHAYSMAHQALPKDENGYYILPSSNWDSWTKESWANWPYNWMTEHPEEAAAANQAMMTKFTELYPQSYWDAYGYNVDVAAIKAGDWSHIIRGTDYPYFPPQLGGGDRIHGQYPIIDQNLESKGYELEVTFRPVDSWDITFNGSKVDATQTGLGEAAQKQLQGMADLFLGSAVKYAGIWGGYEGAKSNFLSELWGPYLTQQALVGTEQPEMRKYRFNVISNYRFQDGWTKGLNVGGAFRWEDDAIIGFGIHETEIYGEDTWIADVSNPYYGPSNQHLDLWAGYEHALNDNINWKLQFNVRNVGETTHLVTVAYEPNGDVAQQRIQTGAEYNMSLQFSF